MPNKYEREIEEILRNLERTEPKPGLGQRLGGRLRRRSDSRMHMPKPSFNLGVTEWCFIIAWGAALFAGGWAFAHDKADLVTGAIAVIGVACLAIMVILSFMSHTRYPTQSSRYGNVTSLPRNPLSSLTTRWNLFLLKLRYRRRKDQ
jgi:hypothetical protein